MDKNYHIQMTDGLQIRPLQNVDILAALEFQFLIQSWDSWFLSQMGTRDSKIQDGEDVDVLRSPAPDNLAITTSLQWFCETFLDAFLSSWFKIEVHAINSIQK